MLNTADHTTLDAETLQVSLTGVSLPGDSPLAMAVARVFEERAAPIDVAAAHDASLSWPWPDWSK